MGPVGGVVKGWDSAHAVGTRAKCKVKSVVLSVVAEEFDQDSNTVSRFGD